jgi:hypothetical protein
MGRYYDGDIEGKFWFATQDSNDGEFFGAEEQESNCIEYYVDKEEFEEINGIKQCKKALTFKHNGKTLRWWVLHNKWNKVIDKHMEDNKGTDKCYRYISFEEWLKTEHNIGDGKNDMTSRLDSGMNSIYVWLARLSLGSKMLKFFKDNPDREELYFTAEC